MAATIHLVAAGTPIQGARASFNVYVSGVAEGDRIEFEFYEVDSGSEGNQPKLLGVAGGRATPVQGARGQFTLDPEAAPTPPPKDPGAKIFAGFRFAAPARKTTHGQAVYGFEISNDAADVNEGDWWEIKAKLSNLGVDSQTVTVARIRRQVDRARAVYDWHASNKVKFYHDASVNKDGTSGLFKDMFDAIAQAKHFIFIADWSFQPMTWMKRDAAPLLFLTAGGWLNQMAANPNLLVAIHTWDHTNMGAPDDQNDSGNEILEMVRHQLQTGTGGKTSLPANIKWRASSRTGIGWSHHQKFLVCDAPGPGGRRIIKLFIGGIDLTQGRFDWPEHPILPDDPNCAGFRQAISLSGTKYDDWYNAEFAKEDDLSALPRQPWHDIHGMIEGPAAWDIVREFVGRWNKDPSFGLGSDAMGDDDNDSIRTVLDKFRSLFDSKVFVQQWEPHQGPWTAQIYRSLCHAHWGEFGTISIDHLDTPRPGGKTQREFLTTVRGSFELSIQEAYRQVIDQAEKYIYIETQYLIGSGKHWGRGSIKNDLEERIVKRIKKRIADGVPFHAYILMPMFPEGIPISGPAKAQRFFEWKTMEYMVREIYNVVGDRWRDYLSFYFIAKWHTVGKALTQGTRKDRVKKNGRYMIYVHSKLMMADDRYVIFGSANLNERSLAGDRDSEICVGLWPNRSSADQDQCINDLRQFRKDIWREHWGADIASVDNPESVACATDARKRALRNYTQFRELKAVSPDAHICYWPIYIDKTSFYIEETSKAPESDTFMPDSPFNEGSMSKRLPWMWIQSGNWGIELLDVAE